MAHFYGTLQGTRGQATRCGTRKSGLTAVAASWEGAVQARLYDFQGEIYAAIELTPWKGQGKYREIYRGPLADLAKCSAMKAVHP